MTIVIPTSSDLPIGVSGLVPHEPPMLILEELRECAEAFAAGAMEVQTRNPYLSAGEKLGAAAYPELVAQLYAASRGYLCRKKAQPQRSGYLVGISDFQITREAGAGERLRIEIEIVRRIADVVMIAGYVKCKEERLAQGQIKLYLAESMELPEAAGAPIESPEGNVRNSILQSLLSIDPSPDRPETYAEFCFHSGALVFCGHFPGYPVLPGVVLIEAAQAVCEKSSRRVPAVRMIEWAKYARPIRPGEPVRLEIRPADKPGALLARFTVDGQSTASILLRMGENP